MSYASATVRVPPVPATSGTSLEVEEDGGVRYPAVPFTGLIWPGNEQPLEGVNAETVQVTAVSGDVVTLTRGGNPIEVTTSYRLAVKTEMPLYDDGEEVTFRGVFSPPDPPYRICFADPQGGTSCHDGTNEGGGTAAYTTELQIQGLWHYRWEGASQLLAEQDFFVVFSDVVD